MKKLLDSKSALNNVLIILPGDIEFRGIQVFFFNIIEKMCLDNISIDIYFGGSCVREEILETLLRQNVGVYVGELDFHTKRSYLQYKNDIIKLMQIKEYNCIHINSGIPKFNAVALQIAKKENIVTRIVHSHSAHNCKRSLFKRVYKRFLQIKINYLATDWIACSKEAGDWMYGESFMEKKGIILNNGIDIKKYIFSSEKREFMRKKYDLENMHIILHVGAFNRAKNQSFLVNVFSQIRSRDEKAKLIMIGTGEKQEEIKSIVRTLGLDKDVIFINETSCVENYMQMADLFILPSTFEGLGIVNIEAQAAGLRCLVSDVVPRAAKVTDLIEFISLSEKPEYWAKCALKYLKGYERNNMETCIVKNNYDIQTTANAIQRMYCK